MPRKNSKLHRSDIKRLHVLAKLVAKGTLKVIDAPLPDFLVAEAVDRARRYTR